jgi:uncharacterized protein with PQ loop repeat
LPGRSLPFFVFETTLFIRNTIFLFVGACMDPVDVMGWIATIVTITYTSYGLPVQFYKNYKKKSTEGLSLSMIIMMFMTFLSWVICAAMKSPPDYYIMVCNSIGAVGVFFIMIQFWMYRTPHNATK